MKQAKGITITRRPERGFLSSRPGLIWWPSSLPWSMTLYGSFYDVVSVRNYVWLTVKEIPRMVVWTPKALCFHKKGGLGGKQPGGVGSFTKSPETWILSTLFPTLWTMTFVFLVQDGWWSPNHLRWVPGSRMEEGKKRSFLFPFREISGRCHTALLFSSHWLE